MKRTNNLAWLVLALVVLFAFPSCQKEQSQTNKADGVLVMEKSGPGECDVITDLLAGQDILVGSVHVTHDELNIYVTYYVDEPGWCLTETHMHIASSMNLIPQTQRGNPKVGHFEYKGTHDCINEYTYTVPIQWTENATVAVAAHAVVSYDSGDATSRGGNESTNETAWAEGLPFPGNSWAMYFNYVICFETGGGIGPETEIAYAYAPASTNVNSECFLDSGIADFWGWQVGPFSQIHTFELWALPFDCEQDDGFHVGEVVIEFKGAKKMDITISTFPGYSFHEAHLWTSDLPWPTSQTLDPEEFPIHAWDLSGTMSYTFRNVPRDGEDIYLILHTLVYGVVHYG